MCEFSVSGRCDTYRLADDRDPRGVGADVLAGDNVKSRNRKSFLSFIKRHDNKKIADSAPPTKSCHDKIAEKAQRHEARNPLKKFFHRFTAEHRLKQEQKKRPLTRLLAESDQRVSTRATAPPLCTPATSVKVPREALCSAPVPTLQAPSQKLRPSSPGLPERNVATLEEGAVVRAPAWPTSDDKSATKRSSPMRLFKSHGTQRKEAAPTVFSRLKNALGLGAAARSRANAAKQADIDRFHPLPQPGTSATLAATMRASRALAMLREFGCSKSCRGHVETWTIRDGHGTLAFEFNPFPETSSKVGEVACEELVRRALAYRIGESLGPMVDMKLGFVPATAAAIDGRAGVLSDIPQPNSDDGASVDERAKRLSARELQTLFLSNLMLGHHHMDWSMIQARKNGDVVQFGAELLFPMASTAPDRSPIRDGLPALFRNPSGSEASFLCAELDPDVAEAFRRLQVVDLTKVVISELALLKTHVLNAQSSVGSRQRRPASSFLKELDVHAGLQGAYLLKELMVASRKNPMTPAEIYADLVMRMERKTDEHPAYVRPLEHRVIARRP